MSTIIAISDLHHALECIVYNVNRKHADYLSVAYEDLRRWTFMGLSAEYIEVRLSSNQRHIEIEMLLPVKAMVVCQVRHKGTVLDIVRHGMDRLIQIAHSKRKNTNMKKEI